MIAADLHPAFNRVPRIVKDKSRRSCVLSSLAVRDFLWKIGFRDAKVEPVFLIVRAYAEDGSEIHSVGAGDFAAIPAQAPHHHVVDTRMDWSGHMVVVVAGWLIDVTLYQASRPQWPELPGMAAAPLVMEDRGGMVLVSGSKAKRDDGSEVFLSWWQQPHNTRWRDGGDAKERWRREPVVKALVQRFGKWEGGA